MSVVIMVGCKVVPLLLFVKIHPLLNERIIWLVQYFCQVQTQRGLF